MLCPTVKSNSQLSCFRPVGRTFPPSPEPCALCTPPKDRNCPDNLATFPSLKKQQSAHSPSQTSHPPSQSQPLAPVHTVTLTTLRSAYTPIPSNARPTMHPPHHPSQGAPCRRSRHELRLEQIAIWGDAAALRPRSHGHGVDSPPPDSRKPPLRGRSASNPTASETRHPLFAPPRHETPFDIASLERDITTAETLRTPPGAPKPSRGSLAMCNSRSADVFRKSGAYAAVARASVRSVRREEQGKKLDKMDSLASVDQPERLVVTRRNTVSIKGREFRVETTGMRGRSESAAESWRPSAMSRRHSEARRSGGSSPNSDDVPPQVMFKSRWESMEMRERDENDFRLSNAKLPERLEDLNGPTSAEWNMFRRGRKSTPILGRYTRSRSSQLPTRSKSRRQTQSGQS